MLVYIINVLASIKHLIELFQEENKEKRERKRSTGARSRGNRGWEEAVCFGKEAW